MNGFLNLYKFELKQNAKPLIIWFISLALILFLYMSMFPSMKTSDMMEIVNAKVEALPESIVAASGLDSSANFQDVLYYWAYIFQFIAIALCVYAINLGSKIISKEHEGKHIDYLATKPINKGTIISAKYSAYVSLVVIMTLFMAVFSFFLVVIYNKTDNSYLIDVVRLSGKLMFVYLFFGTLAFFLSVVSRKTSKTNMLVLGLFFASYVLGVMSKMVDKVDFLKYLSPFFMFETVKSYTGFSANEIIYLIILSSLCLIMLTLSMYHYDRKDLSL